MQKKSEITETSQKTLKIQIMKKGEIIMLKFFEMNEKL